MKDLYIRVKYLDKETGKIRCYTKTLKNMFLSKEHGIYSIHTFNDPRPTIRLKSAWRGTFNKKDNYGVDLSANSKYIELQYFLDRISGFETIDIINHHSIEIFETIVERR